MKIRTGDVAVVTGAASGIGYGLAEAIGERGGRIVLSDVREEAVIAAAERLRTSGVEAVAVVADVADAASVANLAREAVNAYGAVHIVCNNAGLVSPSAPTWEQAESTWRRMIDVKIVGVVNGVRAFAPLLLKEGRGHILNTASSGGLAPLPTRSPYTATMHAVVGLTETLNVELRGAADGVGATVLCPGLVDTDLGRNSAALGAIVLPADAPVSMRALHPDILSARQVAEAAIAAMEDDVVHVAPGAGVLERAQQRVQSLLSDLERSQG